MHVPQQINLLALGKWLVLFPIFAVLGTACGSELPTRLPTAPAILLTRPPTPIVMKEKPSTEVPVVPTSTQTPKPTPIILPDPDYYLEIAPGVPEKVGEAAKELSRRYPQLFSWSADQAVDSPTVKLSINEGAPLAQWTYVIAAPFATVTDEVGLDEVVSGWSNGSNGLGTLILDQETIDAISTIWGPPSPNILRVESTGLVDALWSNRPSWTIMPFDQLSPELKVLRLNGASPLSRDFDVSSYPLNIMIGLTGDAQGTNQLVSRWAGPRTNRDPLKLTRVAMSGVTALGRATAYQMEIGGITAPGVIVAPVMAAADIAHVSHEVSFAPDCPYPNPIGDPIFCARDGYLALIESIGTDVVELTGNHVNDWGPSNLERTIDLYEAAGIKTFGGGRNLAQANEPALFEHHGNKVAFVGCNPVGPAFSWATEERAGSRPCDYQAFYEQIRQLREQGYFVIATLQYSEYYQYQAPPQQQADFKALVEAGATAVSGSQGHHAQGFDFHNGGFIHYGLGNLFFDQMDMLGTRQSFIDTYVIYDGRLISVELFTSLIENYCCPRAMSEEERAQLLQTVFQASGW
jgi:poly-gamma-glutamate synthesis protein (capsule biosynthesis protein)